MSRMAPIRQNEAHRRQAAEQVRLGVVLEVARPEQALLDDVVEGHLADGDEHAPADGPLRAVVQLAEALLAHHANQAVDHVIVTEGEDETLHEQSLLNPFIRDSYSLNFSVSLIKMMCVVHHFSHFLLRSGCNLTSFCILTFTTSQGLQTKPPMRPAKAANAARFGK